MDRVREYLIGQLNKTFAIMFFTLFFIASVVLFVKISTLTSIINLNFLELSSLYAYSMPAVVFYSVPVVFFTASILTLVRLSYDYELVVLFSIGLDPKRIAAIFTKLAFFISLFLLIVSLGLIPATKQLYKEFINAKKQTASVNISPSEFGQSFGEWLVFVESMEDQGVKKLYQDIVLFSPTAFGKESFISAQSAYIDVKEGNFRLNLQQGSGISEEEYRMEQVDFEQMRINYRLEEGVFEFHTLASYWLEALESPKRAKDMSQFILVSLFPLISAFVILSFGINNPRYHKNRAYLTIALLVGFYYTLVYLFSNSYPLLGLVLVPLIWIAFGRFVYAKRIAKFL